MLFNYIDLIDMGYTKQYINRVILAIQLNVQPTYKPMYIDVYRRGKKTTAYVQVRHFNIEEVIKFYATRHKRPNTGHLVKHTKKYLDLLYKIKEHINKGTSNDR